MKALAQGAEAVITQDNNQVIKHRVRKSYRHPEIDKALRQFRTRREAKVIAKLQEIGVPGPQLIAVDDKEMTVVMEFIEGQKVRDVLSSNPEQLSEEIGEQLGVLHNNNIIHHDLTTSNMIVRNKSIHFIDFGLSFFSDKVEDKAVDLHLLERAMASYHHDVYPACFAAAVRGYTKSCVHAQDVLQRFERVKLRGRHKNKGD